MPKCTNDKTKSYTGDEPSPKGLGFCASAEEVGTIMPGKDGVNWIVTQTKTCKKWVKVHDEKETKPKSKTKSNDESKTKSKSQPKNLNFDDFDNLDEDCYTFSHNPEFSEDPISNETGCEEKFGGSKPFFTEGEEWPTSDYYGDEVSMSLLCQFKDPREESNILIRVFCILIDSTDDPVVKILPIKMNEENLKKQIILEDPNRPLLDPYQIKGWTCLKELKQLPYILKKYRIKDRSSKYISMYHRSKYLPSYGIKIGGTPIFDGFVNDEYENFIQLSECKYCDLGFGNYGTGHIYKDSKTIDYSSFPTYF